MKIIPIAADSLGTRSMATFIETSDTKILIDPGVALGPLRYGLPPHPLEFQRLEEHWMEIKKFAKSAGILIVTHYHYDHHDPNEVEIYKSKYTILKHPLLKINHSQRERAKFFIKQLANFPRIIEYSDGREFTFGNTKLKFSQPVFHGTNPKLGYLTEISVREKDFCFVFTSDVEGPSIKDQVQFILNENPTILYLDGPMSYMLGYRYASKSLEESVKNIIRVMEETCVEKIIVDHHLLRDLKWAERIFPAIELARQRNVKILTAAEFLGKENDLLEARRKEHYESLS